MEKMCQKKNDPRHDCSQASEQYHPDIVVMLLYGCYGSTFPVSIG